MMIEIGDDGDDDLGRYGGDLFVIELFVKLQLPVCTRVAGSIVLNICKYDPISVSHGFFSK